MVGRACLCPGAGVGGVVAESEWVLLPSPHFVSGCELGAVYFDFSTYTSFVLCHACAVRMVLKFLFFVLICCSEFAQ